MPDIIFTGPEGRLEGRYHQGREENAPAALILHPHPQHGGTMNNKVVYNLYQTFARQGFSVLRFNFRGVGRSQGVFDNGIGELADAATALDWLQAKNQDAQCFWVAGFSFGAWIAMQLLMRRPELEGFITVSPPANMYDFSFLAPCPSSGLILQGDRDSIVPEEHVAKLASKLQGQRNIDVDYHVIPGSDHFYRETMEQLNQLSGEYIETRMQELSERAISQPGRKRKAVMSDEDL